MNYMEIAITIAVVLLAVIGSLFLEKSKYGKQIDEAVETAKANIPAFEQIANILIAILPAPYKGIANALTEIIKKAIEYAEETWKSGQLDESGRKSTAMNLISAGLQLEGIKPDDKTNAIISDVVDIAVRLLLPKSHDVAAAK